MFNHFTEKERDLLIQRAQQIANNKVSDQEQDAIGLLRCRVGKEWYGVPLPDLTAIYRNTKVIPVPGTPPFFKGVANIRGRILPVLGLPELLSSESTSTKSEKDIVVVPYDDQQVALQVDQVDNVTEYKHIDLQDVPDEIRTQNINHCLSDGTLILNIKTLLDNPELIIDL